MPDYKNHQLAELFEIATQQPHGASVEFKVPAHRAKSAMAVLYRERQKMAKVLNQAGEEMGDIAYNIVISSEKAGEEEVLIRLRKDKFDYRDSAVIVKPNGTKEPLKKGG